MDRSKTAESQGAESEKIASGVVSDVGRSFSEHDVWTASRTIARPQRDRGPVREPQQDLAEVGERVARLAGALQDLGVGRGDRVAVLMLNQDRYLELYLAIAWAGAVIVPLNIRWSALENEDALRDCRAERSGRRQGFRRHRRDIGCRGLPD